MTERLKIGEWSLSRREDGTVGVVGPIDGPGGAIDIANKGRFEQRLLYALVHGIMDAQLATQPLPPPNEV